MIIKFHSVTYRNFLSAGNYDTTIQLDGPKSTLIVGANGSGKSTFLDALSFGLFGKPHRDIKKPQLINSINDRDCRVEVEFTVSGKRHKVVRGMKPNIFEIYQDGVLINQESHNRDYQRVLELNILRLTHKSFHQIVVLGASNFIPFMKLPLGQRREVIEDLLDISIFTKMNILLKERVNSAKVEIQQLDHAIQILNTEISLKSSHAEKLKNISEEHRKAVEAQIQDLLVEAKKSKEAKATVEAQVQELLARVRPIIDAAGKKKQKMESAEKELLSAIASTSKQEQFFKTNCSCPTCMMEISKDAAEQKISELSAKGTKLKTGLAELRVILEDINWTHITHSQELRKADSLTVEALHHQETVNACMKMAGNLSLSLQESQVEDDHANVQKEIEDASAKVKDTSARRDSLVLDRAYLDVISELLKDSGIKTKITQQYIPIINKLVNQYLQILDFYVSFTLDDNFNEVIKSRHRDEFSYPSFSEGEKSRINLALLFTWRQIARMKNSAATNLLVLDEVFDSSLDSDGVENLVKILNTLDDETNVFVISHKQDLMDGKFAQRIEFEKVSDFSRMQIASV